MTLEHSSAAGASVGPDIHVWMSPEEAAKTLETTPAGLDRLVSDGQVEARVQDDGTLQVLVCLPKAKPAAPPVVEADFVEEVPVEAPEVEAISIPNISPHTFALPRRLSAFQVYMPPAKVLNPLHAQDLRRARRWARLGWTAAALSLIVAGGGTFFGIQYLRGSQANAVAMQQQIAAAGERESSAVSDRDRIAAQLAETTQALAKTRDELAVDRNVEDTLIKAALAAHAHKPQPAQLADNSR